MKNKSIGVTISFEAKKKLDEVLGGSTSFSVISDLVNNHNIGFALVSSLVGKAKSLDTDIEAMEKSLAALKNYRKSIDNSFNHYRAVKKNDKPILYVDTELMTGNETVIEICYKKGLSPDDITNLITETETTDV